MLFTSYTFIMFVAVLVVLYYSIPKRFQWILLLIASYVFYALADVKYLLYIMTTTCSTYLISIQIAKLHTTQKLYLKEHKKELSKEDKKVYKAGIKKKQWRYLVACLVLNFGILAVVKYTNFTLANINVVLEATGSGYKLGFWQIALPLGISFYTFQTMGYIIDVYRGKYEAEKNLFKLALFVAFFPQLIQGPISRFDDLAVTLYAKHSFESDKILSGLQRIAWGYFKKVVLADRILVGVNALIQEPETYIGAFAFVGMLFYAYQLYADFTGGIDITIGIAEMLGIKVKENFQRPFFSKSIVEYWRRWHITLGTWFRDYLFYPISVCGPMLKLAKWSRKTLGEGVGKRVPVYVSTLLVWFTTGIWHGASWNFIVWGLANGIVIIISQELEPFYNWFHKTFPTVGHTTGFKVFQVVRTILLMSSIRMFDCYRDVPLTFKMFGSMFTTFNYDQLFTGALMEIGLSGADYMVLVVGLILMVGASLIQRKGPIRERLATKPVAVRYVLTYGLIVCIVVFGAYGTGYDSSQFIYNQF